MSAIDTAADQAPASSRKAVIDPAKVVVERKRIALVLGMTFLYLLTELAFSSRLLDICGADASMDDIHGMETWGRRLTGVAMALFPIAWFIGRNGWPVPKKIITSVLTLAICIVASSRGQDHVVTRLVDSFDAKGRRDAVFLATAARLVGDRHVSLQGLGLVNSGDFTKADGLVLTALLPVLAMAHPDVERDARRMLPAVMSKALTDCEFGSRCIGTPADWNNNVWTKVLNQFAGDYAKYRDGCNAYFEATDGIGAKQREAWDKYVRKLREKGVRPDQIPFWKVDEVRRDLWGEGVEVPRGWNPTDRATFNRVIAEKIRREADQKFDTKMDEALGATTIPKGLSSAQLFVRPEIQKKVWNKILPENEGIAFLLPYVNDPERVRTQVHSPLVARTAAKIIADHDHPIPDYGPGGKLAELGKSSVERLVVPPVALAFSLLGGLAHILKSSALILAFLLTGRRHSGKIAWSAAAVLATVLFMVAWSRPTVVTGSPAYLAFESHLEGQHRIPVDKAVRWVAQAESLAYPTTSWIRRNVFLGYGFGWSEHKDEPGRRA